MLPNIISFASEEEGYTATFQLKYMGLFDFFTTPYKSKNPNKRATLFRTQKEIRKALYKIKSLDESQRKEVLDVMLPYLRDSDSGVQVSEIESYIMKNLSHLRVRNGGDLSDVDWENLKSLLLKKIDTK